MNYDELRIETTFENGSLIPAKYTGYGENISPEFKLENLSPNTKSLVIILEDLSHPIKNFTQWVAWNIGANSIIPEDVGSREDIIQGIAYGFHKYAGPKPPVAKKHNYQFTIYALDTILDLSPNHTKKRLLRAMSGHILQKGTIAGYFQKARRL